MEGFSIEVSYHGRTRQEGIGYEYHASPTALAAASDVLVILVPGGAETRHLVNAGVLAALGAEGVLVNVARGSVVDEAALVEALHTGTIGGAGLGVFEDEPNVPVALIEMPNVVLLPHIASASRATRAAMGRWGDWWSTISSRGSTAGRG